MCVYYFHVDAQGVYYFHVDIAQLFHAQHNINGKNWREWTTLAKFITEKTVATLGLSKPNINSMVLLHLKLRKEAV